MAAAGHAAQALHLKCGMHRQDGRTVLSGPSGLKACNPLWGWSFPGGPLAHECSVPAAGTYCPDGSHRACMPQACTAPTVWQDCALMAQAWLVVRCGVGDPQGTLGARPLSIGSWVRAASLHRLVWCEGRGPAPALCPMVLPWPSPTTHCSPCEPSPYTSRTTLTQRGAAA